MPKPSRGGAIDVAKQGEMAALRLCMNCVRPPVRHRPVSFDLPRIVVAVDAVGAMATIVQVVADGELSPPAAAELTKVVQGSSRKPNPTFRGHGARWPVVEVAVHRTPADQIAPARNGRGGAGLVAGISRENDSNKSLDTLFFDNHALKV